MNIVDSSGWLAYFRGERHAQSFTVPINQTSSLLVPSISISEVFRFILRHGSENDALEAAAQMRRAKVIDLDARLAVAAASIGVELKLPLADSVIYATGRAFKALIWTQDADFRDLEGVKYFAA